jgi:nucleotidyltransferase substrate binding protein (TIGR01987 family)
MMDQEIKWKQRFQTYDKAVKQLNEFIEKGGMTTVEIQSLINSFEYTFELAWKTMKDYLAESGFDVKSPREAVQVAFSSHLIEEGQMWVDALNKRNLMVHTYTEAAVEEAKHLIVDCYYTMLSQLRDRFESCL